MEERDDDGTSSRMWNVKTASIAMIVCAILLYYNIDRINALIW